jgi:hypothetical protein
MTCAAANIQEGTAKQANVQMKRKLCMLSNAQQKFASAIALKASCALRRGVEGHGSEECFASETFKKLQTPLKEIYIYIYILIVGLFLK